LEAAFGEVSLTEGDCLLVVRDMRADRGDDQILLLSVEAVGEITSAGRLFDEVKSVNGSRIRTMSLLL
jgi:hypothetical protein